MAGGEKLARGRKGCGRRHGRALRCGLCPSVAWQRSEERGARASSATGLVEQVVYPLRQVLRLAFNDFARARVIGVGRADKEPSGRNELPAAARHADFSYKLCEMSLSPT